jgi:acetate kinase
MREVVKRAQSHDSDAELALHVYVHRLRAGIAAMSASLGGIDALVFTGGVGEQSAQIRARAVAGLGFLGLAVDDRRNESASSDMDCEISASMADTRTLVIHAREDFEIARQTREVMTSASG